MSKKSWRDTTQLPSEREREIRGGFQDLVRECPLPAEELWDNPGLLIRRQVLTRMLLMDELYRKILDVHGIVVELGVRWGQNLALFQSLRGIHEPYNHNRKIVGFDTFAGFPSVDAKDGSDALVHPGNLAVPEGYEDYLERVLSYHQQESPIPHIRKHELVKGDAVDKVSEYLANHPETIIALAYFDFDTYAPTKACLEAIAPHLTRGSVVAFDELNCAHFPGETIALAEVFGLSRFAIKRPRHGTLQSYFIFE
jgi:hypothetical protein